MDIGGEFWVFVLELEGMEGALNRPSARLGSQKSLFHGRFPSPSR
jgi:hypothetical protein